MSEVRGGGGGQSAADRCKGREGRQALRIIHATVRLSVRELVDRERWHSTLLELEAMLSHPEMEDSDATLEFRAQEGRQCSAMQAVQS